MSDQTMNDNSGNQPPTRLRAWCMLCLGFFCVWFFAFVFGPWMQAKIPTYQKIVQVIEEQDIDAGAYFYTGIEGSYDGERYLLESMKLAAPDRVGLTPPFIMGILLCFIILGLGYRFLPND